VSDDLAGEPALAWRALPDRAAQRLAERRSATPSWRPWLAVAAAAMLSGPFAIGSALVRNSTAGVIGVLLLVAVGPAIEEVVKAAGAYLLAEQRPWLVPAAWTLPAVTLVSGLVFAAVENWWYLVVLIDEPSAQLVRYRWIGGPLLHGGASLLTGIGIARLWRNHVATGRPRAADAEPFLVAAIVVHGAYNAVAIGLSVAGVVE
jgi:RsiW-degrading membrane proteinase PrsW (M82 family)